MAAQILRYLLYALTVSSFATAAYLNIYEVPVGSHGLVLEKTAGLQKPLLQPGRHWMWSGFIPEKWKFIIVDADPAALEIQFKKPLSYTRHLKNRELFNIKLSAQVKYRLSEKSIYFFYEYFDGDFDKIKEYINQRVALILEIKFLDSYQNIQDLPGLSAAFRSYFIEETGFANDWKKIFEPAGIELTRHELITIDVPELELYRKHLQYSDAYLNAQREAEINNILATAHAYKIRVTGQAELEKAENFAQLLRKYPELIKYYRIEKYSKGSKVIVVDSDATASGIARETASSSANEKISPEETGRLAPLESPDQ